MDSAFVFSGFLVGLLVGVTGVGGGSLLTPLLILVFGVAPVAAVGTDLMFAALTKIGGAIVHGRNQRVDWRLVCQMAFGSVPAALLTLVVLRYLADSGRDMGSVILPILGCMLIITAIALLAKTSILKHRDSNVTIQKMRATLPAGPFATALGAVLGVLVTLTSIGAGAFGVVALLVLKPHMPLQRIVGTDIAHAIPLTLVGGIGFAMLGQVDWGLLFNLLLGSLPGIWIGSQWSNRMPEKWLRTFLAIMLMIIGSKIVAT